MTKTDFEWKHVADTADFGERDVLAVSVDGLDLALFRLEGSYYATSNMCTHQAARLSEGEVVECYIECPLHYGLFDIRTGKAQGAPVSIDLRTYPVRVEGTRLFVLAGGDTAGQAASSQ